MQISLSGKIGCLAFTINAVADIAEGLVNMAKAAIKQIAYHDSASTVFKADSGFTRDSAYSPELAKLVEATFKAKLEAIGFTSIVFTSKAHVKATDESKFYEYMLKQGLAKDVVDASWAVHPKNPANAPQPEKAEVLAEVKENVPISLS